MYLGSGSLELSMGYSVFPSMSGSFSYFMASNICCRVSWLLSSNSSQNPVSQSKVYCYALCVYEDSVCCFQPLHTLWLSSSFRNSMKTALERSLNSFEISSSCSLPLLSL
jgi:hypothetical protein